MLLGVCPVVSRNDQDIITVIHYKLLERDKFFFSSIFFFISSVVFFFIQFYDEIYVCNIRNIVVLWDKSLYTLEQLLVHGFDRTCERWWPAHVVNNTYTRWNVFFQFPIALFGIIKLGFLYTHMAGTAHELFFLSFFYQAKGSETKKKYCWRDMVWSLVSNGETTFDAALYASIRTKLKKRNEKKHVQTVKRSTATLFGTVHIRFVTGHSQTVRARMCERVGTKLKLWKLTAKFNSIFVTILEHPPRPSTTHLLSCQSICYRPYVRLCALKLTHWIRHRNWTELSTKKVEIFSAFFPGRNIIHVSCVISYYICFMMTLRLSAKDEKGRKK